MIDYVPFFCPYLNVKVFNLDLKNCLCNVLDNSCSYLFFSWLIVAIDMLGLILIILLILLLIGAISTNLMVS